MHVGLITDYMGVTSDLSGDLGLPEILLGITHNNARLSWTVRQPYIHVGLD